MPVDFYNFVKACQAHFFKLTLVAYRNQWRFHGGHYANTPHGAIFLQWIVARLDLRTNRNDHGFYCTTARLTLDTKLHVNIRTLGYFIGHLIKGHHGLTVYRRHQIANLYSCLRRNASFDKRPHARNKHTLNPHEHKEKQEDG